MPWGTNSVALLVSGSCAQAPPSLPMGTRLMHSTPPATTRSSQPERTFCAARLTASRPEAQKRLICTPEARTLQDACAGQIPNEWRQVQRKDLDSAFPGLPPGVQPDLVVFSAPQLSLYEVADIVNLIGSRRVAKGTRMIITVNAQVEAELGRVGLLAALEEAGVEILSGTCFYVMAPAVVKLALNARTLLTPSTKLLNILRGVSYEVAWASVAQCVEVAVGADRGQT